MGLGILVAGVLSLALWIKFIIPNKEGRHVDVQGVPAFGMILWLMVSLVAVFAGYILLAV